MMMKISEKTTEIIVAKLLLDSQLISLELFTALVAASSLSTLIVPLLFSLLVSRWREGSRPVLLSWFFLPLVVFTVSRSRLALYVLPLFPALILALALDDPRSWNRPIGRWFGLRRGLVIGWLAVLAAVSWGSIRAARPLSWKEEARRLHRGLEGREPRILLFRQERANSLQFYLRRAGRIVSPPEEAERWDPDRWSEWLRDAAGDGTGPIFLFTHGKRERGWVERLRPRPGRIGRKQGISLWRWPTSPGHVSWRRGWDSNPRYPKGTTVFETARFNRSRTSPHRIELGPGGKR